MTSARPPPVPPGPETDAKVRGLFRTEPLDAAAKAELEQALQREGFAPPWEPMQGGVQGRKKTLGIIQGPTPRDV